MLFWETYFLLRPKAKATFRLMFFSYEKAPLAPASCPPWPASMTSVKRLSAPKEAAVKETNISNDNTISKEDNYKCSKMGILEEHLASFEMEQLNHFILGEKTINLTAQGEPEYIHYRSTHNSLIFNQKN